MKYVPLGSTHVLTAQVSMLHVAGLYHIVSAADLDWTRTGHCWFLIICMFVLCNLSMAMVFWKHAKENIIVILYILRIWTGQGQGLDMAWGGVEERGCGVGMGWAFCLYCDMIKCACLCKASWNTPVVVCAFCSIVAF